MTYSKKRTKLSLLIVSFLICYIVIFTRMIFLSIKDYNMPPISHTHIRKNIVDRNKNLLATSITTNSVYIIPDKMINANYTIDQLSKILKDINKKSLIKSIKKNKKFIWVKRDISPQEKKKICDLGLFGVYFENEQKRIYTYGKLLSHVIGYIDRDGYGLSGVEKYFDDLLLENINNNVENLSLTIDVKLQNIVSEELDNHIQKFNAEGGIGIIVNPNNGEILALSSKPDFDPNNAIKSDQDALFNKASLGLYEFGSIFKILTMAIAIDTKTVALNDKYNISKVKVENFDIKDFYRNQKEISSVKEIFAKSSNKGTVQIALDVGYKNFQDYFQKLQIDQKSPIELYEKSKAIMPKKQSWSDISTSTISYGYGVSLSAINFLQSIIPAVNGGTLYPLTLVKKDPPLNGKKVFNTKTSNDINHLLRMVVEEGSAKNTDIKGYYIGAKTGTANKLEGKKYSKNSRISSLVATIPADNPEYIIFVALDNPQPSKETLGFATGSRTAGPCAQKILSRMITLYNITPHKSGI